MEFIEEYEAEQRYNDFINECSSDIIIWNIYFDASKVLKELDPIAYNCGLADYLDANGLTTDESEANEDDEE